VFSIGQRLSEPPIGQFNTENPEKSGEIPENWLCPLTPAEKAPDQTKNGPSVSRPGFQVMSSELRGLPVALGHWQTKAIEINYLEVRQAKRNRGF